MTKAVNYINHDDWPNVRGKQFNLFVQNLKTFYSVHDRLIKGFYEDSMNLSRTLYETFIRIVALSCEPQLGYGVLDYRQFKITEFLRDKLNLENEYYQIMSLFTHSNRYAVIRTSHDIFVNGQNAPLCLTLEYNENLLIKGINCLRLNLWTYIEVLAYLFATSTNEVLTSDMVSRANKMKNIFKDTFKIAQPKINKDVEDICLLLNKCTKDRMVNWKTAWQNIRMTIGI